MAKYARIDFSPPEGVRAEARRGLEWRREHGRGGTEVGVARARDLSGGRSVSPETIRRMVAFFERHEKNKKSLGFSPGEAGYPSAGRIAWALWGGDPGFAWARKVARQMDSADDRKRRNSASVDDVLPLVYAVEDAPRRACRALYPLISSDAPTTWIHVAIEGRWEGHPAGAFELSRRSFEQAVKNFEANPNPVPLDYEHSTEFAIPAPAAGWVQRLEVREGERGAELWALCELTAKAAEMVREGAYRFSSGVFVFGSIDPVSGDSVGVEMTSLALTNVPFIRGATPIALSRRAVERARGLKMQKVDKAALISELRKLEGDALSPEQVSQIAGAMAAMDEARSGGPAEPAEEVEASAEGEDEATVAAADEDGDEKPMADKAKLSAGYDEGERAMADMDHAALMQALEAMAAAQGLSLPEFVEALPGMLKPDEAASAPLSRVHEATIHALSARAQSAEKALLAYRQKEAAGEVDVLVRSGRILDTARADMERLYLSDRATYDRLAAALPEVVPVGSHATASAPPTQDTPSIDEADPQVTELRRWLSAARVPREQQDKRIRHELSMRRQSRV